MHYTTSYTDLRKHLKSSFDKVSNEHEPILVTRRNGDNIVLISQNDYESLEETAYLLKSPNNAERILEAVNRTGGKSLKDIKNELRI